MRRSPINHFKRDDEWMCFHGYRHDMFLVFLCNSVQYVFMKWCKLFWCQLYILLYFMVTVLLKSIYVVYTRSADFILLHVSMVCLKSMFISMIVNLYDEFLYNNLQWYMYDIVIFIKIKWFISIYFVGMII